MSALDVREIPPNERRDRVRDAFTDLDPGESLTTVTDHDPKPLYCELSAEVPAFDDEAYAVEREGPERFVAELPKAESGSGPETVRLDDLDGEDHRVETGELLRFDGERTVKPTAREDATALIVLAPRGKR